MTTNGGNDWTNSSSNFAYRSIQFKNVNTGYMIANYAHDVLGDSIHVLKTVDGGSNWINMYSKGRAHLSSVYFLNENTGWAAGFSRSGGNEDMILKTSNGGINWQIFDYPSLSFINSIFFTSYDTGWYCSSGIFKSINSGANWTNQIPSNGNDYYTSITFTDNKNGWIVGTNGKILSTITGGISSVSSLNENIPVAFSLNQNYPNPFNPTTNINFSIPISSFVTLKIYELTGKEIVTLINDNLNAGVYKINFNAGYLASGIYFYKIIAGEYSDIKKMTLLK
ncbi:MAG: T9SS type A sorting domain-containing protein [bacterium]